MQVRKGWEADAHCNGCLASIHTITYDTEQEAIDSVRNNWNRRIVQSEDCKKDIQFYYLNYAKKLMRERDYYMDETKLRRNIFDYITDDSKFKILKLILKESRNWSHFWVLFENEFVQN